MPDTKGRFWERGQRLLTFYKRKGYRSKRAFVQAMRAHGVTSLHEQHLNKYFAGQSDPLNLAEGLTKEGCDINWLATGRFIEPTTRSEKSPVHYMVREYPVAGRVSAGKGTLTFEHDRMEPGPPGVDVRTAYWFVVKGESMVPRYFPGEMVFVQPELHVQSGDFAVVVWNDFDEGALRQVFFKEKGVLLKSINPKHDPELVPQREIAFIAKITYSKTK
jgi:phage repressor protein C with HTH and peptisase S24 domain